MRVRIYAIFIFYFAPLYSGFIVDNFKNQLLFGFVYAIFRYFFDKKMGECIFFMLCIALMEKEKQESLVFAFIFHLVHLERMRVPTY